MNMEKAKALIKSIALLSIMVVAVPAMAYVGSDACQYCHADYYNTWIDSGHPYKLIPIDGAAPIMDFPPFSEYPNDAVDPPVGLSWTDVTYTIGGYGWKMRWIDSQGYVVTSGVAEDLVQYNFENDSWVTYHTQDEPGTKPYNCGQCHTTGWVPDEDWDSDNDLSDNQDGLPGMHGTFFAGGIHCEECHGEGDMHVTSPTEYDMLLDASSAACGECHTRDAENRIAASGGFIKHHEQYDEWLHSPHNMSEGTGCNACHDAHSSVKFDDVAEGIGTLVDCETCHPAQAAQSNHNGMPGCTDCHMPKASKSAVKVNDYVGDIKTHIFAINTDPVGKTEGLFNEEGNLVLLDEDGQAKMTLDFACYSCHKDENGVGGPYSMKTLAQLSEMAYNIHGTSVMALLQNYEAVPVNGGIDINWTVASPEGQMEFALLRSAAGSDPALVEEAILTQDGNFYSFHDPTAQPGVAYSYQVELESGSGSYVFFETSVLVPGVVFAMHPNHPNPFNPSTTIEFSLNEEMSVSLQILDAKGRVIRNLMTESLPAGNHERLWDGLDNNGRSVASGVYFSNLTSGSQVARGKMLLVK